MASGNGAVPATADSPTAAEGGAPAGDVRTARQIAQGVLVRGVFAGVEESADGVRTFLLVKVPSAETGNVWQRKLQYTPYSPKTGRPSQVADAVASCTDGDVIEVLVDVDAMPWKGQAFPTYTAFAARRVG